MKKKNEKKQIEQSENSMGTARISVLVLKMGVPLMISLLINSLYNFVDSVFVSRISEDALTALSLAAPVQILMSAMGLGIAVGLNAVISKALGEQDEEKVKRTASAALVLAFLAWVLVVVLEIGTCNRWSKWNGKWPDSDCCLQLWGEKSRTNLSELPMGNVVFCCLL